MRATVCVIVVLLTFALAPTAEADDTDVGYLPILAAPQLGLGLTGVFGNQPDADHHSFDGTLRLGYMFRDFTAVLRPGVFTEVHTVGFDSVDFSFGPMLETRLAKSLALQTRLGVGAGPDVPAYAEAGLELGNTFAGVSVTGRREFDDGGYRLSVNVEVTTALALLPFVTLPRID